MKYLYAYECEKKSLSSPAELQAAIDGNRREGRRPSYSSSLFSYSPATTGPPSLLCPPKIRFPIVSLASGSGTSNSHLSPAGALRKGQSLTFFITLTAGDPCWQMVHRLTNCSVAEYSTCATWDHTGSAAAMAALSLADLRISA